MFQKSEEHNNVIIQKIVVKNVNSHHVLNRHRDFLETIIEFLRFLNRICYMIHQLKFEIDRIVTLKLTNITLCRDGQRDVQTLILEELPFLKTKLFSTNQGKKKILISHDGVANLGGV